MLKEMKNLFKKDKKGFTITELERQKDIANKVCILAVLITAGIGLALILGVLKDKRVFYFAFPIYTIIAFILESIASRCRLQLEQKELEIEQEKYEQEVSDILCSIQNKDFYEIDLIEEATIQGLFHEATDCGLMTIEDVGEYIRVEIKNREVLHIPKETIGEYFSK